VLVRRGEHRFAVKPGHHHVESLDAFRGLTIAGMILVNNPGTWDAVYVPLVHADWNGCTFADLVFPFFLVILGAALPFALARRRAAGHGVVTVYTRIARRAVLLFALGFVLNLVAAQFSWTGVRIPGVLQRIAIVYLVTAIVTLHATAAARAVLAAALMLVHWWILTLAPMTPRQTIAAAIDHAVFGRHLLLPTYDPEGLLGTVSAIASALVGTLAGEFLRDARDNRARVRGLAAAGAALTAVGWIWSFRLPLNKPLWTGSYALFTAGLGLVSLAACFLVIDAAGIRRWARPFVWLGVNPLAIYFLAELVSHVFDLTSIKTTLYWGVLRPLTSPWLSEPATSLLFATLTVAAWTAVAGIMYRRGIRVQV
jgi:predicted acyltransferase